MSTATSESGAVTTAMEFRAAMRRLPTTVVVAGGILDGQPVGMVVGTFTSVSMDPLLVGFLGDNRSSTLASILRLEHLSFNVLDQDDDQTPVAFQRPIHKRFDTIDWHLSPHRTPVIDSAVLTIHTRMDNAVPAGDHQFITAEVLEVEHHHLTRRPLVYVESRMTRLDPWQRVPEHAWQLGWE